MRKMHSRNPKDEKSGCYTTRCGRYVFTNEMTNENEFVTCRSCLKNIEWEGNREPKTTTEV